MSLSIIVLAAGKGSRMLSAKPKVLHEVGNYPMLFHILDSINSFKDAKVKVVIASSFSQFKSEIKSKYRKITFSTQIKQNGTADAVTSSLDESTKNSNTTLVLCGDTPLISQKTLKKSLKKFHKDNLDLCVISMIPDNETNSYGKLKFENKKLIGIVENSEITKDKHSNICNSGIMIFKTKRLIENLKLIKNNNKKKEYFLTDLVEIFKNKNLSIDHFSCDFIETLGVNCMKDLARVNFEFQKIKRNYYLSKGVQMVAPETIFFSYDTQIGKDVTIQPNVYFGLEVKIKDRVTLRSFSYLDNVIVSNDTIIGPYARIRDGVEIKENSRIGNFVEIKKSKVDKNVKISHLSYVGDSIINSGSNIGAGAITCNYDGFRKNKTIIGKNCFIGSNTSLVAPLNIKKGSVVGAGTVVNKDVPIETVVYRKSELIKKNKKK